MAWENIQGIVYLILAILAALTAILGILFVNHLYKKRPTETISNAYTFFFSSLGFGYACFALAELCWYLIFKSFSKFDSGSMPDFYWVIGAISLFLGFTIFYIAISSKQGKKSGLLTMIIISAVCSLALYYLLRTNFIPSETSSGLTFLGYFYPMISLLILISSIGAYLFLEKQQSFGTPLLLMVIANVLFFAGDLLYSYVALESVYGLMGFLSDLLYILAYSSCCLSFYNFLIRINAKTGEK